MKILIVKTSALGDIVHTFPAIEYIKHKYPHAELHWIVEQPFSSLVTAHPHIDHVIEIDTKKWRKGLFSSKVRKEISSLWKKLRQCRYDVVFDLQANMKSGLITLITRGGVKVGYTWQGVSEWPNLLCTKQRIDVPKGLSVRDDYLYLVQSYFNDLTRFSPSPVALKLLDHEKILFCRLLESLKALKKPLVMVCQGSNWKNKQLSPESLQSFLHYLQNHLDCHFLFTWGFESEKQQALKMLSQMGDASLCEKVTLPVLQHLMAEMQCVISMDSLPLHLAATTSTPTFSVFGPSLAARYAPQGNQHVTFQGSCTYGRQFETRCPILRSCKTGACIRSISGKHLFDSWLKTQNH